MMLKQIRFFFSAAALALAVTLLPGVAQAEPTVISSSGARVPLLELYTSEGCSSCPPADRWMSMLKTDPRLWSHVVPVALHVNYWDRLGWPDRYATAAFGGRQRDYARKGNLSSVYTPGFVLDGREWRSWFRSRELVLPAPEPGGSLVVKIDGDRFEVDFAPASKLPLPAEIHVALLGFGLATDVQRGENAGRTLQHDFVVLSHRKLPLGANDPTLMARGSLPVSNDTGGTRRALAAWVQVMGRPEPLQAAGGWLPWTPGS